MIRHIVSFKFKEEAEGKTARENGLAAKEMLLGLMGKVPTLRKMEVGVDITEGTGNYTLCLISEFDDMEGLNVYAVHPEHLKVVDFIKKVNEGRSCVDYEF